MTTTLPAGASPFRLDLPSHGPVRRAVAGFAAKVAERVLGLTRLEELYAEVAGSRDLDGFLAAALRVLGTGFRCDAADLARIPRQGPLLVVANHPFGALDGLLLGTLLRRVRDDVRILANRVLLRIPELRELFFSVDIFGQSGASASNVRPMRHALRWLEAGGALGVFPAGEVAHLHLRRGAVTDAPWNPQIARLARVTGATVLPVHFTGRNSAMFQLLGLLHPRVRTALLPREAMRSSAHKVTIRVGAPIAAERLAHFTNDDHAAAHLRLRTFALAQQPRPAAIPTDHERTFAPIVDRPAHDLLCSDLRRLPREQWLVESCEFAVGIARAPQIPELLREIGRLREITFRNVGEGTGRCTDLDRFDRTYLHLFCWDRSREALVGAYRLGPTDEILAAQGRKGLYTSTLFHLRRDFLHRIDPGLELGRSFVAPEYQRSHAALLLLWRGIGTFVARNPRYRRLFGPVSISNRYEPSSRRLIVEHLRAHAFDSELANAVAPRRPFHSRALPDLDAATAAHAVPDLRTLSEVVSAAEPDGSGVPVLVREYLKLGGKLLGFHVDRAFGDSLDGLVLVDLLATEPRLLARYLGVEGAAAFTAAWARAGVAHAGLVTSAG